MKDRTGKNIELDSDTGSEIRDWNDGITKIEIEVLSFITSKFLIFCKTIFFIFIIITVRTRITRSDSSYFEISRVKYLHYTKYKTWLMKFIRKITSFTSIDNQSIQFSKDRISSIVNQLYLKLKMCWLTMILQLF